MKKLITALWIITFISNTIHGQINNVLVNSIITSQDYNSVISKVDAFIRQNEGIDTVDKKGFKEYVRWKWYWENRVNKIDGFTLNSFENAYT